jgi:HlyD family secretion protein
MKRWLWILILLAIVGAAGYFAYDYFQTREAAAEEAARAAETTDDLDNVVWASGTLLPRVHAELSPMKQGTVAAIFSTEGTWVEADELLLALDNALLQHDLERAEASRGEAQAALDKLLADATPAEIAAAQANVAAAEAAVAQAAGQMLEIQAAIDSAEALAEMARREYSELASHPTEAEATAAAAEVAIAEANVAAARAAYNLVRGNPNVGALPESQRLQEATAALEAAMAQRALTGSGPTPEQLAVAAAAIDAAEENVAGAVARGPGAEAALQAAMAQQASAQAALDKLLAGATAEDIAVAEAHVVTAQVAVDAARAELAQSEIRAPFAGQVGAVEVQLGEQVVPGEVVLLLGDTGDLYVETSDLRETDVVYLDLGMPVEVTFDALPNRIFNGTITRIAPVSSTEKGGTNYTVEIDVADLDETLRWGMTAFVNIQVER